MSAAPKPLTLTDTIPMVCTSEDVCRALNISRSTFHRLRRTRKFPIPELDPRIDDRPRFAGQKVREYLDGKAA
jgi:hypothetical protein